MIFAKYDLKSISKHIQRVQELGETVNFLKNITKILNFCVFSKKKCTIFYNFCGTDVKQTYC